MKKKKRVNITKIIIFIILTVLFITMGIVYSILRQEINITGKSSIQIKEELGDYIVTYVINDKWFDNKKYFYRITMTLFNNTDKLLDGWTITTSAPENAEIVNYASVNCKLIDNKIEFKNVSYNAQVPSKQSINFEFQISTTDPYYNPGNIIVNGEGNGEIIPPPSTEEKKAIINLQQDNVWNSENFYYYQYTIKIKNTGKSVINSWQFNLNGKKEYEIEQLWNAIYEKQSDKIYNIKNSSYNGIIQPEEEISFGRHYKNKI